MWTNNIEKMNFDLPRYDITEKLSSLHLNFESKISSVDETYLNFHPDTDTNIAHWLGVKHIADVAPLKTTVTEVLDDALNGIEIDGKKTLGLLDVSNWKINPEYAEQNLKQHAGYAAEIISTAKENLRALLNGTGIKTVRADDLPELFQKNDQYVDKVRIDAAGNIIERIQVKFVGKDAADCLSKLMSKRYDKYFTDGMVDRIEIPKDYYKEIIKSGLIEQKIETLQKQLDRMLADGNTAEAAKKQLKIDRLNQIKEMLMESTVSSQEAINATLNPNRYIQRLFAMDLVAEGHKEGTHGGLMAAGITCAISTVDNIQQVFNEEITPQEAFADVAKETGKAGAIGYSTAFVSTAISHAMSESSYALFHSLNNAGIPAAVVSFGVESYDSTMDYAQGIITGKELAYDLGENASGVLGSAVAGAAAGSVVPGGGTVVGFATGLVGSMVGYSVATAAYQTAVKFDAPDVEAMAAKTQELANNTIDLAKQNIPEKVDVIRDAMNNFALENDLPFKV